METGIFVYCWLMITFIVIFIIVTILRIRKEIERKEFLIFIFWFIVMMVVQFFKYETILSVLTKQ